MPERIGGWLLDPEDREWLLACKQALVVEISGTTRRPDGSTYHITWSLADRREAVESNDVLRRGWTASGQRHPIRLDPSVLP